MEIGKTVGRVMELGFDLKRKRFKKRDFSRLKFAGKNTTIEGVKYCNNNNKKENRR